MPRGDQTGPEGMGPRTGRAAGFCAGYEVPGYANPVPGRGSGMGRGGAWGRRGGRGWRRWFHATGQPRWARTAGPQMIQEDEANALKAQASWLNEQLESIQQRLRDLQE